MENKKKQLLAAYGLILSSDQKFLLVQRASHDTHPGLWELPGGAVEMDEDPEHATKREVLEETGLDVTVVKPLATTNGISSKGHQIIRLAYLCEMNDTTQNVILSDEHSAFQWVSIEKKPDLYLSKLVEHIFVEKKILEI